VCTLIGAFIWYWIKGMVSRGNSEDEDMDF
jgi:hypothetical protein